MAATIEVHDLDGIAIFSGIPTNDLSELVAIADEIEIAANEVLFAVGQTADAFFVLLTGGIDLVNHFTGPDERLLAHVGPGAIIGETSLLIDGLHSASARATEPTRLLRFPDRRFQEMLDAGALPAYRLVANLARVLAARLRAADRSLIEIVANLTSPAATEDDLDRLRKIFFTDWRL